MLPVTKLPLKPEVAERQEWSKLQPVAPRKLNARIGRHSAS